MEKVKENGKASLGDAPTLHPIKPGQVRDMVKADIQRVYSLLDCIYKDPVAFDSVCDALYRRYENLRVQQAALKDGDLFNKAVDEQSE